MINPVFFPLAFMGGRSWAEISACDQIKSLDSSILIGAGGLVSTVAIYFGQTLFWQSIPSTTAFAGSLALVLTVVYALFYRLLIRASEVANWFGKCSLLSMAFALAGVNATLAGHELVMLPFAPQVQEMTMLMAQKNTGELRSQSEKALGMGTTRQASEQARGDADKARERLQAVPPSVLTQQKETQACDQQAQRLYAALPDAEAAYYSPAYARWRDQRSRCAALNRAASQALAQHRAQALQDINDASQRQQAADQKLSQSQAQSDSTMNAATPAIQQSATTGFGRHKALWAAVEAGNIPAWSAYGLMLIALVIESAGLLLKLFLPKDEANYARVADSRITSAMGDSELAYTRAFRQQIKPAMRGMTSKMQTDAEGLVKNVLSPSMNTRFTADQFARAARAARDAQKRSRTAATPVVDELAKVMPSMVMGSV